MRDVCGFGEDDTFIGRAIDTEFYGLHGPDPVGAVLIDADHLIHVGSLAPCGFAVRRIVREALRRRPYLIAAIHGDRPKAVKLAQGMGFALEKYINGWTVLRRYA